MYKVKGRGCVNQLISLEIPYLSSLSVFICL